MKMRSNLREPLSLMGEGLEVEMGGVEGDGGSVRSLMDEVDVIFLQNERVAGDGGLYFSPELLFQLAVADLDHGGAPVGAAVGEFAG